MFSGARYLVGGLKEKNTLLYYFTIYCRMIFLYPLFCNNCAINDNTYTNMRVCALLHQWRLYNNTPSLTAPIVVDVKVHRIFSDIYLFFRAHIYSIAGAYSLSLFIYVHIYYLYYIMFLILCR